MPFADKGSKNAGKDAWMPAGMGKRGANAPWKCCKVSCALVVTV